MWNGILLSKLIAVQIGTALQRRLFEAFRFGLTGMAVAAFSPSVFAVTRTNSIDPVIQIFTGGLDGEGVISSSLHVNGAPSGPSRNYAPGFTRSNDILLITPELDYGLTSNLEGSVYMPMVANFQGGYDVGGGIGRLTWLPWDVPDEGGFFAGTTWAFSGYKRQFSLSSYSLNGGFTTGYEDDDWLLALNGFVNWNLSGSQSASTPSFSPAVGIKHYWGEHLGLGVEYYGDIGSISKPAPLSQQYQAIFGVMDWDEEHWSLNLGVGRGMTANTDEWMVKMIFFALIDEPQTKSKESDGASLNFKAPKSPSPQISNASSPARSAPQNGLATPSKMLTPEEDDDDDD